MGNSGLSRLFQPFNSNPIDETTEASPSKSCSRKEDEASSTVTTGSSLDYRSAQGENFSDEDKQSNSEASIKHTGKYHPSDEDKQVTRKTGTSCISKQSSPSITTKKDNSPIIKRQELPEKQMISTEKNVSDNLVKEKQGSLNSGAEAQVMSIEKQSPPVILQIFFTCTEKQGSESTKSQTSLIDGFEEKCSPVIKTQSFPATEKQQSPVVSTKSQSFPATEKQQSPVVSTKMQSFPATEKQQSPDVSTKKPIASVIRRTHYPLENKSRSQVNMAKEVLQIHYTDLLVDITHPYSLVSELLQRHMIDTSIGNAMLSDDFTRREKMVLLVDSLIKAVSKQPANFDTLIRILGDKPFHRSVAKLLQESHGRLSDGKEVPTFKYSPIVLKYTKELKASYSKLPVLQPDHHKTYNLMLKKDVIKYTLNRRAIFQSPAFVGLHHSLFTSYPIASAYILDCNTSTECVLIEGERCSGKTQLVWELCQKWEEIPALKKYQLILLLDLKSKRVQSIENLSGVFDHHDTDIQQELIKLVCDAKGKDVLIIMDGFEQLPFTYSKAGKTYNSFIMKIIEGKVLPKSTKLITSTSLAIRHILSVCDVTNIRHIQLLGVHREEFTPHIGFNMQSLIPHPSNSPLLSEIHLKCIANNSEIPATSTQLVKLYCCDLILESLSGIDRTPIVTKNLLQLLKELHPDIHKKIMLLSKVALVELLGGDISCIIQKDFVHFGLMFSPFHHEQAELRFINHMVQAFLAAYYVSHLEDYERDQIFFNHSLDEMSEMWKFVAGLNALTSTIIDMMKSSVDDQHYLPFIVSLLHEQQDASVVKYVFKDYGIVAYSLRYPEDSQDFMSKCYSLGYCIAASNCDWKLDFSLCDLKAEDMKALIFGLTSLSTISGSVISLELNGNLMTYNKMVMLSELPTDVILQIRSLNLNACHLTEESLNYLAERIIPLMPHLQMLDVGNNPIQGHCKMMKLLESLANLTELQELNLEDTVLDFEDMVPLNQLLSMTESTVVQLSFGGRGMPLESMALLTDTALTQSFVETLRISDLDLTRNIDSITLVETNMRLTKLVLFECNLDITYLATSLCMNTALRQLDIFFPLSNTKCDIGSQEAVALSDMLEVNRSLSELSLYSYKPLERKKVTSLLETLKYNYTLQVLQLPNHYSEHFSAHELDMIDSRVYWRMWPCITVRV